MTGPNQTPNAEPDGPTLHPTRWPQLLMIAFTSGAGTWLICREFFDQVTPISLLSGGTLYVLAIVELVAAILVRNRVRENGIGIGPGRLHPIAVARAVVLAKVSAWLGAVAGGFWIGMLGYIVPRLGELNAADDALPGVIVGAVGAAALVAAALLLERSCRSPDDPEAGRADPDRGGPDRAGPDRGGPDPSPAF